MIKNEVNEKNWVWLIKGGYLKTDPTFPDLWGSKLRYGGPWEMIKKQGTEGVDVTFGEPQFLLQIKNIGDIVDPQTE